MDAQTSGSAQRSTASHALCSGAFVPPNGIHSRTCAGQSACPSSSRAPGASPSAASVLHHHSCCGTARVCCGNDPPAHTAGNAVSASARPDCLPSGITMAQLRARARSPVCASAGGQAPVRTENKGGVPDRAERVLRGAACGRLVFAEAHLRIPAALLLARAALAKPPRQKA
jgi:hypothetical protein